MKKLSFYLLAVSLIAFSCTNESDVTQKEPSVLTYFNNMEFQNGFLVKDRFEVYDFEDNLQLATMPIETNSKVNTGLRSYSENYMLVFYDKAKNTSLGKMVISANDPLDISPESFSGDIQMMFLPNDETINLNISYDLLKLDFETGKIATVSKSKSKFSYREATCNGITEKGGALDCAGHKFATADCCFEEASCYLSFMFCLAYRVADCYINDCEMN